MADELVRRSYSRRDKDAYESESDGELETEALFEEVAALEEKVQSLDGTRDKQELLRTVAELRDVRKRYNRALGQGNLEEDPRRPSLLPGNAPCAIEPKTPIRAASLPKSQA